MQKLIMLWAVCFMLVSCGGGGKDKKEEEKTAAETATGALSELANAAEKAGNKSEELKKLTPLSTDALKALLPETLAGMKRKSFNVANSMGFAVANAEYEKDDTTGMKLMFYDCAGEAGAAFYGMNFFMRMNVEQEDENGYSKTVDFMDAKAVETYEKYNNKYQLTYLTSDRFLVSLEGRNTGLDVVKEAAKSLDYDKLKGLK